MMKDRRQQWVELDQRMEHVVEAVEQQDVAVRDAGTIGDATHLLPKLARYVRVHPSQDRH